MGSLDGLDRVLKGGLAGGRWSIFYDINNQSGLCHAPEPEALEYLGSCKPSQVPLRTNCRNSRLILEKVQKSLGADMGVRGAGAGPAVRERTVVTREESALALAAELHEIIEAGGVAQGCVTILSPEPFESSNAALLPNRIRGGIEVLDEFSMRSFPTVRISFARIGNFKGMENEAIIVVDLPAPQTDSLHKTLHYVAMGRARALLSIIAIKQMLS